MKQEITKRNASIAARYMDAISHLANGMLLTGSNAWGPHYAVTEKSDIDLLIVGDDIEELDKILERFISEGLLGDSERSRFKVFRKLYEKENAEQFSVIASYEGVPVSIDFLTVDTLRKIASLSPMGAMNLGRANIRFIKEFRTNAPKALGYSLDDLCSPRTLTYNPAFSEIKDGETTHGYLSETVVDAIEENEGNYFLGVMSFYLTVAPKILFERNGELTRAIGTIRSNIKNILDRPVTHVTRQEKMSADTLKQVLGDF